jgi:glycosyltransferase involved in cell wall biosynthesis
VRECVAATDVGNVSLWSRRGSRAVIVPPCDREALAGALSEVLDDDEKRRRIAALEGRGFRNSRGIAQQ